MRTRHRLLVMVAVGVAAASPAQQKPQLKFNFDGDTPGEAPKGFTFARTGQGPEGRWLVRAGADSPSNHVLVQAQADVVLAKGSESKQVEEKL